MNNIRVNGSEITAESIYQEMQYFPAEGAENAQQQAAQSLIIQELLRQQVKATHIAGKTASSDSDSEESLTEQLLEQEVYSKISELSEVECLRYYQDHQDSFRSSPTVEAHHILLAAAPDDAPARKEKREQAEAIIKRLQDNPEQFALLAKKHSDCSSKESGGSLGQISQGQTVAEFEKVLFKLATGLCAYPVDSRYGVHIIRIEHSIKGERLPYDYVREKIRGYLKEQSERHAIADYLRDLVNLADIDGFDFYVDGKLAEYKGF
jgi:peptidyl-prolyl cis-trans isomerase C